MGLRFRLRFRVWMPLLAVLLVLLSVATLLLYVLPTAKSRLSGYAEDRAVALADAAAYAAAESEEGRALRRELRLLTDGEGGEVLVVDGEGQVVERVGRERLLSPPSEELLQQAAEGERINDSIGEQRVAMVPVVREGDLAGGVIFAPGDSEDILYQLFLRSGIEAAVVASVLGGGLALLLATLLSRRVERISRGAREMGRGDFSSRIKPGFDDELGVLARTFNSMAERLEDSFLQLEEKSATLDAILNNLVEGVVVIDLSGNVTFINRSARAMLGIGDDLSGKLPSPFEDFDLPEAVARCAQRRECGEARVRDGEGFLQVRLEHVPAFDEHKGGVLVVIRDLSEGRRLEANQQRFLANAAHELKTPITTILGASELLLTESKDDPEVRRRFLEHILSEANRMQRLSDTLLRLARTGVDMR
ncbi:MAG: HAMP domain-containing protein, partial [Actinomycetota bacterium]|nr:HAMP domain-containing protein [Actinomycetota bacterium]